MAVVDLVMMVMVMRSSHFVMINVFVKDEYDFMNISDIEVFLSLFRSVLGAFSSYRNVADQDLPVASLVRLTLRA